MKRRYIIIVLLALLPALSGCSGGIYANNREIADLLVVRTVGFDLDADGVTVSVSTGKDLSGLPPTRLVASGESAALAMDALQARSDSLEVYYPHTSYLLLGSDAAGSAGRFLDVVERSDDLRLGTEAGGEKTGISEILDSINRTSAGKGGLRLFTCA